MFTALGNTLYLLEGLAFVGFLLLPVLFLVSISVLYFVVEAIRNFRERWGQL